MLEVLVLLAVLGLQILVVAEAEALVIAVQ
jgi:hypothetical protein